MRRMILAVLFLAACTTMQPEKPQVARVWHGVVPAARADEYQQYLYESGIKKIRAIPRNLGAEMLRREIGDRTEFIVISYWPSLESVKAFAGEDITKAHFLPRDREFLIDPDLEVKHYVIGADR